MWNLKNLKMGSGWAVRIRSWFFKILEVVCNFSFSFLNHRILIPFLKLIYEKVHELPRIGLTVSIWIHVPEIAIFHYKLVCARDYTFEISKRYSYYYYWSNTNSISQKWVTVEPKESKIQKSSHMFQWWKFDYLF